MTEPRSDPDLGVISPSPQYVVDAFLDLANVVRSDVVYDLGCNDARVLIAAAERRQAKCVGIERDAVAYNRAKQAVKDADVGSLVHIILGDATMVDLSRATVLYLYLSPTGLRELGGTLRKQLSSGTRVISYMFRIPEWDEWLVEVKGATSGDPNRMDVSNIAKLYLYQIPERDVSLTRRRRHWRVYFVAALVSLAVVKFSWGFRKALCCCKKNRVF